MHFILMTELKETPTRTKRSALGNYRRTLYDVENAVQSAQNCLSRRYKGMQKLIDELTEEEIDAVGLNVNYAEFVVKDFLAIAYKEKESLCADSKLIESLESAYKRDID